MHKVVITESVLRLHRMKNRYVKKNQSVNRMISQSSTPHNCLTFMYLHVINLLSQIYSDTSANE